MRRPRSETRPKAYVNITTPNASKTFGSANAGVRDGCRPSIANWPTNSVVKMPRQTNDMNWNHMFSSRLRKPNGTPAPRRVRVHSDAASQGDG